MESGIQPDFLICRSERPLADDVKRKIALFCNVDFGAVIESADVPTIYQIPLSFEQQGFAERVMERLRLSAPTPDLGRWRAMVQRITHPPRRVRICVVGKYTDYVDSYKSVQEALIHGGIANDVGVELAWTSSDHFTSPERAREILGGFHGLLTGMDNLRFICRIYNTTYEDKVSFVQDFSELGRYLHEPVKKYSAGMRARLAFALSMIIEFDCFLIDEVVAVGDDRFKQRCQVELFQKRNDRAMIIVSHSAAFIQKHCTRVCVLLRGRLHHFPSVKEGFAFYTAHSAEQ
jgi:ABC-type transport system involved in cytochrome c biogenesis ATPase subunit